MFTSQSVSAKSAELSGAMCVLLCVHYMSCCIITDITLCQHSLKITVRLKDMFV